MRRFIIWFCIAFVLLFGTSRFVFDNSKVAEVFNSQFGRVAHAEVEGFFSDTLRLDWTPETTKLNAMIVLGAVGKAKETVYGKGIRYFKFPNDAGAYNVIDWKTGNKSSVSERAPYYFK